MSKRSVFSGRKPFFIILVVVVVLGVATIVLSASAGSAGINGENKRKNIKLLTANKKKGGNITSGGTADLYLEVKEGSGEIFMNTYPVAKADTQLSTRFANSVACDFLEKVDCSTKDFFYTIKAESSIVGGPSAGSAIAVLTVLTLEEEEISQDVSITGTIDSGGIIGPVAGIEEKIKGGARDGLNKILIPKLEFNFAKNRLREEISANNTVNSTERKIINNSANAEEPAVNLTKKKIRETEKNVISEVEKELGVDVVRVTTLRESLNYFSEKEYTKKEGDIRVPKRYSELMKETAEQLCSRRERLLKKVQKENSDYEDSENISERIEELKNTTKYYSLASSCFTETLSLREEDFENVSRAEALEVYKELSKEIKNLEGELERRFRNLSTITDLETYAIVKERLLETKDVFQKIDSENISRSRLSYSYERLFSAKIWRKFFQLEGKKFVINKKRLKKGCTKKIIETEDTINYINLYTNGLSSEAEKELSYAKEYYSNGNYALCLFKASKAKGDASTVASALTTSSLNIDEMIKSKIESARKNIREEQEKGMFPILGYSYYEYSDVLKEYDKFSSLNFAEYSLELGRLNAYFPKKNEKARAGRISAWISHDLFKSSVVVFLSGLLAGVVLALWAVESRKDNR